MISILWGLLLISGLVFGVAQGHFTALSQAFSRDAVHAVQASLQLAGLVSLWFGISRIAEASGLVTFLARLVAPLIRWLFPGLPPKHPALGAIVLNLTANGLGLGNAATPFGLKAMSHLQELNPHPDRPSAAMVTFLAINSAAITLVPTTTLAIRAASAARDPSDIVVPGLIASVIALSITVLALLLWRLFWRPT
ncbi:MAG: nucleoside recognition domain-containing protein [Bacillota bacterium]|nr:nucleoside recognition domain-containing protein [Bacillota bacterium]